MVQTSEPCFVQRQIDLRITFIGTCFHKGEGLHSGPAAIENVTKTLDGAVLVLFYPRYQVAKWCSVPWRE